MKKNQKKTLEISIVVLLSIITAIIAFFSMRLGRYVSLVIFGLGLVPILIAYIFKIDGGFGAGGMFYASPADLDAESLEPLFRHKVLSMLRRKGLITGRVIELISSWRHSGFNVYCSQRIYPRETKSMENLARYIIRASFWQGADKLYKGAVKSYI